VARFKRLTDDEARTLTPRELLPRVEAEQAYWARKKIRTDEDRAAAREFSRILFTYLDPGRQIQAVTNLIEGRPDDYMDRPCGETTNPRQEAS